MSPSDMVGPSPVTSNGTETTEIDDEVSDDVGGDYAVSEPDADPTRSEVSNAEAHFFWRYLANVRYFTAVIAHDYTTGERSPVEY